MNITGQVLLEEKIYLTGSDIVPVNLHALPPGIYQMILIHDSAKLTRDLQNSKCFTIFQASLPIHSSPEISTSQYCLAIAGTAAYRW
jgi:hypothetical protein